MTKEELALAVIERLKKESLAVTVGNLNISQLCHKSVSDMIEFFNTLELSGHEKMIGGRIIKEIRERLGFLKSVGLEYLTLSRSSGT